MKNEKLKRCPFCGRPARMYYCDNKGRYTTYDAGTVCIGGKDIDYVGIRCTGCGIHTKQYKTHKGAYNAWQRRVDQFGRVKV